MGCRIEAGSGGQITGRIGQAVPIRICRRDHKLEQLSLIDALVSNGVKHRWSVRRIECFIGIFGLVVRAIKSPCDEVVDGIVCQTINCTGCVLAFPCRLFVIVTFAILSVENPIASGIFSDVLIPGQCYVHCIDASGISRSENQGTGGNV